MPIEGEPASDIERVLVSMEFKEIFIEVRRHHDSNWLVYRAPAATGTRRSDGELLEYQPQKINSADWCAAGGMLPPNARSANLVGAHARYPATTGRGAWVACASERFHLPGAPLVQFLDASDELVALPWPAGDWAFRELPHDEAQALSCSDNAGECFICGSVGWLAGRQPSDAGERIACSRCGYSNGALRIAVRTD